MAVTKTLGALKDSATWHASVRGQIGSGTTFRHETDDLNREANDVFEAYREESITKGFDFYVTEGAATALPTTRAFTGEQYALIDWPEVAQTLKRVDVLIGSEGWDSLERLDWDEIRAKVPRRSTGQSRRPTHYAVRDTGSPNGASVTVGKIALLPFAPVSGSYRLSYVARHTVITNDSHLFVFPSQAGAQYCVYELATRICIRDGNRSKRLAFCEAKRQQYRQTAGAFGIRVVASGPATMRRSPNYHG